MSGAAPIPYIGSRISLISVSGIRYEGILFSIDPKQSTVALQNVRSFGTEGRRKDGQQIPASLNVYDYIIFRGSDIKDLQVCEPPPQPAQSQPPNDPAIINAPSMYGYGMYQYPYNNPYQMYNSYGYPGVYPPRPQMGPVPGQPFPSMQPLSNALPGQPGTKQPATQDVDDEDRADAQDASSQVASSADSAAKASSEGKVEEEKAGDLESVPPAAEPLSDGTVYTADHHGEQNGKPGESESQAGASLLGPYTGAAVPATSGGYGERRDRSSYSRGGQRGAGQRAATHSAQHAAAAGSARSGERRSGPPSQSSRVGAGGAHSRGPQGSESRGSGPRSGGGNVPRYNAGAPQKLPEFDFEKANSKFDKEKIKEEVLKGTTHAEGEGNGESEQALLPIPAEKAYDKSTSFFDSISCEALDRLKDDDSGSRSERRRNERSLNAETFGRAANDRRVHHRGAPRRYGPSGVHQHGSNQPMDNRPTRGGYSSAPRGGGYAGAVRGSQPAPQKRFAPKEGQATSAAAVVGH